MVVELEPITRLTNARRANKVRARVRIKENVVQAMTQYVPLSPPDSRSTGAEASSDEEVFFESDERVKKASIAVVSKKTRSI